MLSTQIASNLSLLQSLKLKTKAEKNQKIKDLKSKLLNEIRAAESQRTLSCEKPKFEKISPRDFKKLRLKWLM